MTQNSSEKNKKKLLTIGHSYVVALNRSLMREVAARGNIEVTVLAPEYFHGDLRSLAMEPEPAGSQLNVRSIRCQLSKKIHFFYYDIRQLKKILRETAFDYCYLWEEPYIVSGIQVAWELKRLHKPYSIFTAQNIAKTYPFPFSVFEKKALNWSQSVWPCGELVNRALEKKGFAHLNRQVLPLPVDLKNFKALEQAQRDLQKEKLGLKDKKVIGFMGRFTPEKGIRLFMKAAETLLENKTYGALIMGSGPLEKEIRSWVSANKLEDRVKVISVTHSAVPTILPAVDVLLCPSQPTAFWEEQFGRMIVEAMACGVPVIGSRSGEIPFVIDQAGIVLEPTDLPNWIESTRKVLWQESFAQELIKKGLEKAQIYSARVLAPQVEKYILAGLSNFK